MDNFKNFVIKSICYNHSGKMEGMNSLSTSALENTICCARAKDPGCICSKCYSRRQLNYQPSTREKCRRNHEFYTNIELTAADIPKLNASIFRFEAFGELQNTLQFKNYCLIAGCNPYTTFTLWTKNLFIIAGYIKQGGKIPRNLYIIYSSPNMNTHPDQIINSAVFYQNYTSFVDAIFTVWDNEQTANNNGITINCGSRKCIECRKCYSLKHGEITFINELLK